MKNKLMTQQEQKALEDLCLQTHSTLEQIVRNIEQGKSRVFSMANFNANCGE